MRIKKAVVLLLCAALLGMTGGDQNNGYFHTEETWSITMSRSVVPRLSQKDWEPLRGLRVLFLGDSQFCGYSEEEHDDLWTTRLETEHGLKVENRSTVGSTLTDGLFDGYVFQGRYDPICARKLPEGDFDVVFVGGGCNDWLLNEPLGTPSSRDVHTFSGALNTLLDRLEREKPGAKLVYVTGFASDGRRNATARITDDYFQAASEVCQGRNVYCLRACDPQVSGIYAADPVFRENFFLTGSDCWHLNRAGHGLFLPVVGDFLLDIFSDGGHAAHFP